jgi:hypothetical protein
MHRDCSLLWCNAVLFGRQLSPYHTHHIPEDCSINTHCCKNLESQMLYAEQPTLYWSPVCSPLSCISFLISSFCCRGRFEHVTVRPWNTGHLKAWNSGSDAWTFLLQLASHTERTQSWVMTRRLLSIAFCNKQTPLTFILHNFSSHTVLGCLCFYYISEATRSLHDN